RSRWWGARRTRRGRRRGAPARPSSTSNPRRGTRRPDRWAWASSLTAIVACGVPPKVGWQCRRRLRGVAMLGLMQDRPLTLAHVFHRAEQLFGHKKLVTATADGETETTVA